MIKSFLANEISSFFGHLSNEFHTNRKNGSCSGQSNCHLHPYNTHMCMVHTSNHTCVILNMDQVYPIEHMDGSTCTTIWLNDIYRNAGWRGFFFVCDRQKSYQATPSLNVFSYSPHLTAMLLYMYNK